MKLDEYMKAQNLKVEDFCETIGCSRCTLIKARQNIPVDSKTAQKIAVHTNGHVQLPVSKRGRPRLPHL